MERHADEASPANVKGFMERDFKLKDSFQGLALCPAFSFHGSWQRTSPQHWALLPSWDC